MDHRGWIRRIVALLLFAVVVVLVAIVAPVRAQQEAPKYKNLKVLPKDITPAELRPLMSTYTRALGVRCTFCHVGEEGKPIRDEDFQKDDKEEKQTAREMMKMVNDINSTYLGHLHDRADPPVAVKCVTCHRGATRPRMLQDVLQAAYQTGGLDSTVARYQSLRDRYYGRFTYDFGDVPLSDVANQVRQSGHPDDALRLQALNVQMNPQSPFAKRQHAGASIAQAFRALGADSGAATYASFKQRYGPSVVSEGLVNDIGYTLLGEGKVPEAIAAFRLNTTEHPASSGAFDSLGEGYMAHSDWKLATEAYTKSLALDPTNDNAKQKLEEIKTHSKDKKRKK